MRKILSTTFATIFVFGVFVTSASADHVRRDNNEDVVGAIIFSLALGIIAGAVANDRTYHQDRVRRDYRRYDRNNYGHNGRRLSGIGERVGAGDYCPYLLEYHNGRYYCVR